MKSDSPLSLSRRLGLLPVAINGQNQSKSFLGARLHRIITREDFSARELETMRLLALGLSNKEVATEMGLRVKTIEWYRNSIHKRLGIHDVVRLVHCAIKLGVIPCPLHGAQEPAKKQDG